jgi:hypothetical protein
VIAVSWKAGMVPLAAVRKASSDQSNTAVKPTSVAAEREGGRVMRASSVAAGREEGADLRPWPRFPSLTGMSLRAFDLAELRQRLDSGFGSIENEVLAEKASSLGHHGRQVEKAMAALRAFDAEPGAPEERLVLLKSAAREVWKFFVQRELCGLRDQKDVIRHYGIPGEVLVRLGAIER